MDYWKATILSLLRKDDQRALAIRRPSRCFALAARLKMSQSNIDIHDIAAPKYSFTVVLGSMLALRMTDPNESGFTADKQAIVKHV